MRRTPWAWIRRRARRIQRAFNVPRKVAVFEAASDWLGFLGVRT